MSSDSDRFETIFRQDKLDALFPPERTIHFFEALFGDNDEGAYDIRLTFKSASDNQLFFHFELHQRPGRCLACNLTYGLPQVFQRHPVIDTQGVVTQLDALMNGSARCGEWKLDRAKEISRQLHAVPLIIELASA
ncbi:MAG: pancreas/duodenum homeobox protein 1 [Desulfobacteraceae bacterium]